MSFPAGVLVSMVSFLLTNCTFLASNAAVKSSRSRVFLEKRAEDMGEEWREDSLVFLNTRGNMVYNRNLQESLYKIYKRAGIEGATMHMLRHIYATRCSETGMDIKAVSEQLGHKDVKTTYNVLVSQIAEKAPLAEYLRKGLEILQREPRQESNDEYDDEYDDEY